MQTLPKACQRSAATEREQPQGLCNTNSLETKCSWCPSILPVAQSALQEGWGSFVICPSCHDCTVLWHFEKSLLWKQLICSAVDCENDGGKSRKTGLIMESRKLPFGGGKASAINHDEKGGREKGHKATWQCFCKMGVAPPMMEGSRGALHGQIRKL